MTCRPLQGKFTIGRVLSEMEIGSDIHSYKEFGVASLFVMALIQDSATTAVSTATASIVTSLWNHSAVHAYYLIKFEDTHESLTNRISDLKSLRNHVKRRVEVEEANEMTRTPVVDGWLQKVEAIEQELDLLLHQGSRQIQQKCIGGCCFRNWWTCYNLGKKASKKLKVVEELISSGNIDTVADKSHPSSVQVIPEGNTVGMDAMFNKVWKWLGEEKVNIIGIYGMGGVGKTTLLKRMHNAFDQIAHDFHVVIWVVVSREFSMPNVQKEIGKRLGLVWPEDESESGKAQRIFNTLRKKKFVLMLDDIWQPLDLEAIGIPFPGTSNSKVVLTTRFESVCRSMDVNKLEKMTILDWDQAWILFQQKVGQDALGSHAEIPNLAAEVAKQCGGLPLALITIGRAMATKKTLPEWNYAVKTLKNSASKFLDMEDRVLATLKFSFDSLQCDTVKNCFLYFSLYPENASIEKSQIVKQWIGEGFLDEFEDYDDAFDKGHDVIGSLKAACLLEDSTFSKEDAVTMHDIVRDMALWIACECGKKKNKYLVQANIGLTGSPNAESWKDTQRISVTQICIKELKEAPKCPNLHTLFIMERRLSSSIASCFFQHMPGLRVLILSKTRIIEVPKSIGYLVELRYLDLAFTRIRTLPDEVANLTKLRLLDINHSAFLTTIPQGMISKFSKLQRLNLQGSGFKGGDNIFYPSVAELECLEHLRHLGITVRELSTLETMCLSPRLRLCLRQLGIFRCRGLTQVDLAPSLLLGKMKRLERVWIQECLELEEVRIGSVKEERDDIGLLSSLERLFFINLPKMKIIWNEGFICFKNLAYVKLYRCAALKDVSWLVLVPLLAYLQIDNCRQVEDILAKNHDTTFSKLEFLALTGLPKLASISRVALPLPSLKEVNVHGCPLLKKLPFTSNSTKKPLLKINGETEWWNKLEWEEETVKSSFQGFFKEQ